MIKGCTRFVYDMCINYQIIIDTSAEAPVVSLSS